MATMSGDEDDGTDWVAICEAIDAACAKGTSTTTRSFPIPTSSHLGIQNNNKPTSSRQSTLDKFVGFRPTNRRDDDDDVVFKYSTNDFEEDVARDDESVSIDPEAAKTWIYPEYPPVRDYQVSIAERALFENTLVSLPTGLGKTLIAAVVMYNYYRWFPQGKIVFAAPSRPLVMQQIEACHKTVGIPQERAVDLTGQTNPLKRASLWKDKQIFFVTPQTLEKDIQSGSCPVKQLVCLVIDEAHRASGNYSYCVVVRELMAVPVHFRILALTATPGCNHQTVQQVIDNLQISRLEYRSESDHDVISYLHDRQVELIQVQMGKDAVDVFKLLMDVIRVQVKKLSDLGVHLKRDPQTLSPVDFLNSRANFRQFPPQDLDPIKYPEVERLHGVLITLYHIRRLLSAHGIRPAFEMLEEKLKQGYFACLFSRNETIHKAKIIMQENLSHGANSPKFSKLLEVLLDHFKKHDPQKSRVIIFSHFRDSVRDIMSSLGTLGEHIKATEFVGQNSGKTSKGQSQKVQQAVLQKFRAGGYNVIVATSIGEEGLDIMEVDLVVCFDANVSPIRMIQRMGRTGRKSKGRVVVLACEGTELSGYKSKQAKGKAVNKHMVNPDKSFRFHPSLRMVPHVYRPERKLVKFSIEEFIPRGKKAKEDDAVQIPKYKLQLTDVETDLLEKYFDPARQDDWKPSLIAFPHFQAFPSRVNEIAHSTRTTMLIDTMQYLQEVSFNGLDEEASEECLKVETVDNQSSNTREDDLARKEPETYTLSRMDISKSKENRHSFLFGSDFITVDSNGNILIMSVPLFPLKPFSPTKTSFPHTLFPNCLNSKVSSPLKASSKEHPEIALDLSEDDRFVTSLHEDKVDEDGRVFWTEICNSEISKELSGTVKPDAPVDDSHSVDADDLSPRLTNLLMSGVIPESPVPLCTSNKDKGLYTAPDHGNTSLRLVQNKNDEVIKENTPNKETGIPQISLLNNFIESCSSGSKIVGEVQTPLRDLSYKSCSKDWVLSSGDKSVCQPKKKLKRLRKVCDIKSRKEDIVGRSSVSGSRSCAPLDFSVDKPDRGDRKLLNNDARVFIDDEAEASSEASEDDEVDNGEDSYGGSFIDDRINPTMAITQAGTSQFDMMAVYRRSLLTQSPMVDFSPDNTVSVDDGGSEVGASLHTNGNSSSALLNTKRLSSDTVAIPSTTDGPAGDTKRLKVRFSQGGCGPLPVRNLEKELSLNLNPEVAGKDTTLQTDEYDEEFFEGIDFDALEEEARLKLNLSIEKPKIKELDFLDSPSFDLGI